MYAISIEALSKKYRVDRSKGKEHHSTLRDAITERVHGLISGARPFRGTTTADEFWALKDVSFNVGRGEKFGIIGRNGAGKSTLLKLLSRITAPTSGRITLKGRVTSLLEVGTGFHPELSGRENIFLNGSLLGMRRSTISRRLEQIVDFAGVEDFLELPVKRYSSGMKARLGFAVAAHLDSDILIVDEVLAVGDAEFQRRCLGRMDDIARSGNRTVLFVSHDLGAVQNLCDKVAYLKSGSLVGVGPADQMIDRYLSDAPSTMDVRYFADGICNFAYDPSFQPMGLDCADDVQLSFAFDSRDKTERRLDFALTVLDSKSRRVIHYFSRENGETITPYEGRNRVSVKFSSPHLSRGDYFLQFMLFDARSRRLLLEASNLFGFTIRVAPNYRKPGIICPPAQVQHMCEASR